MLIIFHGNDEVLVRGKARTHTLSLVGGGAEILTLDSNSFDVCKFQETFFSQTLAGFGASSAIIFCDHVFENEEAKNFFEKFSGEIHSAVNHCVIAEKTLSVGLLSELKKIGVKIFDFKVDKRDARAFNTFALGDALGMKDKKNLWVLFAQARELGLEGEEVCGVLFWQIKNILLAGSTKTSVEAGVSEYPYKKAKSFAKVWKESELKEALLSLAKMYHNAHRGKGLLMNQLELFVLGVK